MSDGVNITIVGADKLSDGLEKRAQALSDPSPLLDLIGLRMLRSVKKNFVEGGRPTWKKSIRAEMTGGQTLRKSGRLQRSYTHAVQTPSVLIGTNTAYARIHELGGVIVPRSAKALRFMIGSRFVTVRKVTIPKRPALVIQPEDAVAMLRLADRYVSDLSTGEAS